MTPRETWMAIEAAVWREERCQKLALIQAWKTASLIRSKRLPDLRRLLAASKPAKPLRGKELEKRRREFKEAKAAVDTAKLAESLQKRRLDR